MIVNCTIDDFDIDYLNKHCQNDTIVVAMI